MSNINIKNAASYHGALLAELAYYKEVVAEQKEVIKQLVDGPGEFEYIHPLDLAHIINNTPVSEILEFYQTCQRFGTGDLIKAGKRYVQSVHIPAKHKEII